MNDFPCVKFNEPDYVKDIDDILNQLIEHGLLVNVERKDFVKPLLLSHDNCNTILGLLLEFDKLRFYFDEGSKMKVERICMLLHQLNSHIVFDVEY